MTNGQVILGAIVLVAFAFVYKRAWFAGFRFGYSKLMLEDRATMRAVVIHGGKHDGLQGFARTDQGWCLLDYDGVKEKFIVTREVEDGHVVLVEMDQIKAEKTT